MRGIEVIARKENFRIEHLTILDYKKMKQMQETVIIDLLSWFKSQNVQKHTLVWPDKIKANLGFITSCESQEKIIELLFHDCVTLNKKISRNELRNLFRNNASHQIKRDKLTLTQREKEIIELKLSGAEVKFIASDLNICVKTVYAHLYSVLIKSGCKSLVNFYFHAIPLTNAIAEITRIK